MSDDELIAARRLAAGPERVWAAFTEPAGIAAFWGGSHATVPPGSVSVDLRAGGGFALDTRAPGGATRRLRFVYVSVAAPRELVFDEPATGIRTTVALVPAGDGTDLTVHQRRLPPQLRTPRAAAGLAAILEALADHLAEIAPAEHLAEIAPAEHLAGNAPVEHSAGPTPVERLAGNALEARLRAERITP